ncbi:protocatechuate 3,4-dioxygenase subunit alpha [Micrococcales bacterium 31B]|nr:protocatechuate 3,4-dioxygenase subunit alpha [Micrococcales bacterium 31B]
MNTPAPTEYLDDKTNLKSWGETPSQTVGPYLSIGLTWEDGPYAVPEDAPGVLEIHGILRDKQGDGIWDGLIETWQADPKGHFVSPEDPRGAAPAAPGYRYYARSKTEDSGRFFVRTVKPGPVPDGEGGWQAPHINVNVLARGVLQRLPTRIYFEGDPLNETDPLLNSLPAEARESLIARFNHDRGVWEWDVNLQGDRETTFFTV